jgi:hypothetical protein
VELREEQVGSYLFVESIEREGLMTTNPVFVVDYRKI